MAACSWLGAVEGRGRDSPCGSRVLSPFHTPSPMSLCDMCGHHAWISGGCGHFAGKWRGMCYSPMTTKGRENTVAAVLRKTNGPSLRLGNSRWDGAKQTAPTAPTTPSQMCGILALHCGVQGLTFLDVCHPDLGRKHQLHVLRRTGIGWKGASGVHPHTVLGKQSSTPQHVPQCSSGGGVCSSPVVLAKEFLKCIETCSQYHSQSKSFD